MRDERLFPLFQPLDALPGIGPKLKPVLERLVGGEAIWDLLLHMPERWLDRRPRDSFDDLIADEVATVRGEVHAVKAPYNERAPTRILLFDGSGFLTLTYFRADSRWLQAQFPVGKERIVSGKVTEWQGERQMSHPDFVMDPARGEFPPPVEPIYPLTAGLTNKRVHATAQAAVELVDAAWPEWIDPALKDRERWPGFKSALEWVHAPEEFDEAKIAAARKRLSYDEALARELSFARARTTRRSQSANSVPPQSEALNRLVKTLPYKPTDAQVRATKEIMADLGEPHPMRRMLQGDVGAGKTLVGAFAAVQAAEGGFQTAFMAPTEVLARQQYDTLDQLLSPLGYSVAVLTGRDKGKAREATLMGLADGSIQIVAGTHALFQEGVGFKRLAMVIVDEQHRFGVADRMKLMSKGKAPHMLVMSATPIPRTLAQTVHGDLDISILDEKPAGRQPVETRAIPDARIDDVISAVGRALQRGERAFWVCPRVDADDEDGSSAVARAAMLKDALQTDVGLVHGRLKGEEKDAALDAFRSGQTKILVATTVIEVGVDVPEATIMVIERAEGFGLAQLHQLRGRVGRGSEASYCLLLYRPPLTEMARERLDTLRRTEDGFEIAEADFKLRGPGDLLGKAQSGLVNYRLIDLPEDEGLIEIARKDAQLAIETADAITPDRADGLSLLSQLLSPDLRFSD
ncbi:MAG: ATP-dependent DNA helicase RecG [Hyphomonadaceae bacterium]|nr:ATP-dependent DNA helicase RecG [Hyphomonadaceae bacterium]